VFPQITVVMKRLLTTSLNILTTPNTRFIFIAAAFHTIENLEKKNIKNAI
jgi:hypothetical protein